MQDPVTLPSGVVVRFRDRLNAGDYWDAQELPIQSGKRNDFYRALASSLIYEWNGEVHSPTFAELDELDPDDAIRLEALLMAFVFPKRPATDDPLAKTSTTSDSSTSSSVETTAEALSPS